MIDLVLSFLRAELSSYLNGLYQLPDKAVLVSLPPQNGVPTAENVVSITLVNIELERAIRNLPAGQVQHDDYQQLNPALQLNLRVLFATNFTDYPKSLKFLAATVAFFQGRSVFTPQNSPRLQ